jgi:hypothetical protein
MKYNKGKSESVTSKGQKKGFITNYKSVMGVEASLQKM